MMAPPALLALWMAVGATPAEFTIQADLVDHFGEQGLTRAEGHASIRSPGLWLDAEHLVHDEARQLVTAVGAVVVRVDQASKAVITAEVVTLRLEGSEVREVYALEAQATLRKGVTAAELEAVHSVADAARLGRIQALLLGNHFTHQGSRWTAERVSLTPCECDFARPGWSIEASSATVDSEAERVAITSALVTVRHIPVLWVPWLSLPLTDRQSGLLFPRPSFSGLNGFSLEVPVFLTLGRSADITLTPGLFAGGSGDLGLAGPRLDAELRYAPTRRAVGRLLVGLVDDLRLERDALKPSLTGSRARGLRGELGWSHQQDLDGGFGLRTDLNLHSDGYYFRDVTTDVIASTQGLLRSTAVAFQRGTDHLVSLEVVLRQDLGSGYDLLGQAPHPEGSKAPLFGPGTLQRWPALSATIPLRPLLGPLSGALSAELVRLSPLFSRTGDEGASAAEGSTLDAAGQELSWASQASRLFGAGKTDTSQGDRIWQPGEREARDRLMVVPRLQLSGVALDALSLSAAAWWRQLAWVGEASGRTWQRGTLVLDVRSELEASRTFGGWRHTLTPLAAVRAVPAVVSGGSDPASPSPVAYDEVDVASGAGQVQAVVELRQRLARVGSADSIRLDLGQGLRLAHRGQAPRMAETYGRLSATLWLWRGSLAARVDGALGRLTRFQASTGLDDARGHGLSLGYENLLDDGTDRTRAPLDLLFGAPVPVSATSRAQLLSGAAYWSFGWLSARYELLLLAQQTWARGALALAQHALTLGFTPACDCWRLDLSAIQRTTANGALLVPDFGATLTVAHFGSLGTR